MVPYSSPQTVMPPPYWGRLLYALCAPQFETSAPVGRWEGWSDTRPTMQDMVPTWTVSDIRATTDNVYQPGWANTTIDIETGGTLQQTNTPFKLLEHNM